MHFPWLINIRKKDKVLEVGPGITPFYRSDVLLEKRYSTAGEFYAQCGEQRKLLTGKTTIYYEGGHFPFSNNEFDYVICSHVLEHVEDLNLFVTELKRVAKRGYIEFPTIFYEYLYNFDVHKNIMLYKDGTIYWMKKSSVPLSVFRPINLFFQETLRFGQDQMIVPQKKIFFQGFEWFDDIRLVKAACISDLCPNYDRSDALLGRSNKLKKDFLFIYKVWMKISILLLILKRRIYNQR